MTTSADGGVELDTGRAVFGFAPGGSFPFSDVRATGHRPIDAAHSGFRLEQGRSSLDFRISTVRVLNNGPLRAEVEVHGVSQHASSSSPLQVSARVHLFAGTATARVELTARNRRRAKHPSGQWILGDEGSLDIQSASLVLHLADPVRGVKCSIESGASLAAVEEPFEIHQESSGGERWNSAVHRDRDGIVPLRFRGCRLRSGSSEHQTNRATPIVMVTTTSGAVSVAVPQFWQNFPRSIAVGHQRIEIGLFPRQADRKFELQGGEQKTHVVFVAFGDDAVSDPPLAWCHEPLCFSPSPEWAAETNAVPFLLPAAADPNSDYLRLVNDGLDAAHGFVSKREAIDEYGWRHFGDLYADHETARQAPGADPIVSHYNNQYDALAGFAIHFLRTADLRWHDLMCDLASHVRDIDIYHTVEDKSAYNGGLFWHTEHYTDAGTSTHRTYPRGSAGGGPAAEHNYNVGLMLHYFLTGERASFDAAVGLGRWVIDMDDGRQTVFRWLAGGATGTASATGAVDYHGPGRGPANSILACLVASRLSGDATFAAKADELIKRCIHPTDDIAARNLLDVESRWYYTVFLQVLGIYLHEKESRREFDAMFGYARESLLRYTRWMAQHERPYLDRPEVLEFPTETWAAQDMRKADVFLWAARHTSGEEQQTFFERARFFSDYSVSTLNASPTRHYTRPIVLMLTNGVRYAWVQKYRADWTAPAAVPASNFGAPKAFEPQKLRAIRRAKWLLAIGAAAGVLLLVRLLL